jgi:hypothetical protein
MTHTPHGGHGVDEQAVLLVVGLADLAGSAIRSAAGAVQHVLRRSDGPELARDVQQDLMARGRITLDRLAAVPPAHLEVLAQHALARRAASGGDV